MPSVFNLDSLTTALGIARRLTLEGFGSVGLALVRELLASAENAEEFQRILRRWRYLGPSPVETGHHGAVIKLPSIAGDFFATGHRKEAVRVMGTGVGLTPALDEEFVHVAERGFSSDTASQRIQAPHAAVKELNSVGLDLMNSGSSSGISLVGAACRVRPESIGFPLNLKDGIDALNYCAPISLRAGDVHGLMAAAGALEANGRVEAAARIGSIVNSIENQQAASGLVTRLASERGHGGKPGLGLGLAILNKGYPGEAVNLLMDTGIVEPEKLWKGITLTSGPGSLESAADTGGEVVGEEYPESFSPEDFSVRGGGPARASAPSPPAAGSPPAPSFHFRLEGDGARCDQVLWGADFDLVFNYGVADDAGYRLKGKGLGPLVKGKHDLIVVISPHGLDLRDGAIVRQAHIEDGAIKDPPRFLLKAPAKDAVPELDPEEKAGVAVSLLHNMAPLYSFFLEIHLVEKLDPAPCAGNTLDLDLEDLRRSKAEPRQAIVFISSEGDAWNVHWIIGESRPMNRRIVNVSAGKVADAYTETILKDIGKIAASPTWKGFEPTLEIAEDDAAQAEARKCMSLAMSVGWKLYEILASDPVFKEALDLLNALEDQSRITVMTEDVVFPWELMYPIQYDLIAPNINFKPEQFWGARFEIESLIFTGSAPEKQPPERQQPGPFFVSMGFNDAIDKEWAGRPLLPVSYQKDYCNSLGTRAAYAATWDELVNIFTTPLKASMIYLFCHGAQKQLEFYKDQVPVTPQSLLGDPYPDWPIVFLNTCEAGDIKPLSLVTFRNKFREKQAAGVIAPSFPIPTLFAAVFGKVVLERYAGGQPIGRVLFELRAELLRKNIPLGLWYSLQCPLDVKAPAL